MEKTWIYVFVLLGLCTWQGWCLRCFICDTTSAQSYAKANAQCNVQGEVECHDKRATACMLEGYMQPNNQAQVVKRCVLKCPVFINTTAEVVRCCPKDGCNEALDHRPPPRSELPPMGGRGRFPPPPGFDPNRIGEKPDRGDRLDMMDRGRKDGSMDWDGSRDHMAPPPNINQLDKKTPMPKEMPPSMRKDGRDVMREKGSGKRDMKDMPRGMRDKDMKDKMKKSRDPAKSGKTDGLSGTNGAATIVSTLCMILSGALLISMV